MKMFNRICGDHMMHMTENSLPSKHWYEGLQILRWFAFLCIFLVHNTALNGIYSCWGVTVFFILSGFLNALHGYTAGEQNPLKEGLRYGIRKIRRIYPLHVIMTLAACVLEIFNDRAEFVQKLPAGAAWVVIRLLTNLLLITDWIPLKGLPGKIFKEYNIVSWFLSCILLFYFITPVLLRWMDQLFGRFDRRKRRFSVITAICIVYVCMIIENSLFSFCGLGQWYIYENPLSRIGDYLVGLLAGYLFAGTEYVSDGSRRDEKEMRSVRTVARIVLICSIIVSITEEIIGEAIVSDEIGWVVFSGFYFTIPVVLMIAAIAVIDKTYEEKRHISIVKQLLIKGGSLTMYAYLIHVPVINAVHGGYRRIATVNLFLWVALSGMITMGLSIVAQNVLKKRATVKPDNRYDNK